MKLKLDLIAEQGPQNKPDGNLFYQVLSSIQEDFKN